MQESQPDPNAPARPQLGLGACLAGQSVRYDGESNSANAHVLKILSQFETRTFCPEVGIGLGVPRPPIHLVGETGAVQVLDVAGHQHDYTMALSRFAQHVLDSAPMLCAYILVTGSPSCGNQGVKRFSAAGEHIASDQQGMFARALGQYDPLLPCADDEQLTQRAIRKAFVIRAMAYHSWKLLLQRGLTKQSLRDFYCQHRHSLETEGRDNHRKLQQIIEGFEAQINGETTGQYFITTLMGALPRIHDLPS